MPDPKAPPGGVTQKRSRKKNPQRTREISVVDEAAKNPENSPQNSADADSANTNPANAATNGQSQQPDEPVQPKQAFQLGVEIPHSADEVFKNTPKTSRYADAQKHASAKFNLSRRPRLGVKIWNILEWLATSALIFMVLFFIINYNAYSTLFLDKLNQLRGTVQTNPFIQNLVHQAGITQTQQPLPITATSDQSKKQIPYLNLEVAPPDDRVIIPRINRNVPVVKVSTENLIKRDWGALEADIQESLRYGVVHYPGTAEPGENGNVVITGHSSYFSWDPGRFKDVFALLHEVAVGDTVIVYHNQKKYFYQVYQTQVVTPDKIDILTQRGENRLTLITCTPVGTNLKRLVVFARPTDS